MERHRTLTIFTAVSSSHKGFTLLELLLVVGMIAMVASAIGMNMFAGIAKARDTRRLQDMKDIQKALQLSFITDKRYPIYTNEIELNGTDPLNTLLTSRKDAVNVFKDPLSDGTNKYWYKSNANGTTYEVRFCMETSGVPNRTKGCTNVIGP